MVLDFIRSLLQDGPAGTAPEAKDDPVQIATCVLLLEVAIEDGEFDATEREHIENILQTRFDLSETDVDRLISRTREARSQAVDLWRFTNDLNQKLKRDEKMQIMQSVWQVIYADGHLHLAEDRLAHKFGKLLRLSHDELIETKLAAKKESGL